MLKEIVHVAIPTAFHEDETIHIGQTFQHIKSLQQSGIHSILISGSTGEQHSLSVQEKEKLIDHLVKEQIILKEMEVIFGVSAVRMKDVIDLIEKINKTDISGIMLGFPPYIIPSQKEAIYYAETAIEKSEKPIILYNNPRRTGFDLSANSIVHLSRYRHVIGVKDPGNREKMEHIHKNISKEFSFYAGGEVDLMAKVNTGYNRLSSIAGNVYPNEVVQWFAGLLEYGTENKMMEDKVMKHIYNGNAIVQVKNKLHQAQIMHPYCRSPIGKG